MQRVLLHRLLCLLIVACLALTMPARAEETREDTRVDLELILAVDVSRSMTARELEIQRRGYAEALVAPDVIKAIEMGPTGRIALTYVEWAGSLSQRTIVEWTVIAGREDAEAFAARLTAHFDSGMRRTSISGIIDHAAGMFDVNGYRGLRRVIDISGDGPNNQGRPVHHARDAALARGITINGLPLMTREGMGSQWHLDDLDVYYRHCVIGGANAFVIPVLTWEHFPDAVRQKLVLELVGREPADRRLVRPVADQGYDCLIGERIWEDIMGDWN